jgi:hypothetical protein
MTSVTVRLSDREIKMLKARTGETDTEAAGKGRRFRTGREAIRWLES